MDSSAHMLLAPNTHISGNEKFVRLFVSTPTARLSGWYSLGNNLNFPKPPRRRWENYLAGPIFPFPPTAVLSPAGTTALTCGCYCLYWPGQR